MRRTLVDEAINLYDEVASAVLLWAGGCLCENLMLILHLVTRIAVLAALSLRSVISAFEDPIIILRFGICV